MTTNRIDFKVVLLGGFAAGKTSLLIRLTKSRFSPQVENTIAGVFTTKEIQSKDKLFRLGIWDTCGQERFRSLVKMYYRDANAAVVCYDITDATSWINLKHYVQELRDLNPDCLVYICGTKKDCVDFDPSLRQVDLSTVSFYTKGIQAKWFETSSKSGENVGELFQSIADDIGATVHSDVNKNTITLTNDCIRPKCRC